MTETIITNPVEIRETCRDCRGSGLKDAVSQPGPDGTPIPCPHCAGKAVISKIVQGADPSPALAAATAAANAETATSLTDVKGRVTTLEANMPRIDQVEGRMSTAEKTAADAVALAEKAAADAKALSERFASLTGSLTADGQATAQRFADLEARLAAAEAAALPRT